MVINFYSAAIKVLAPVFTGVFQMTGSHVIILAVATRGEDGEKEGRAGLIRVVPSRTEWHCDGLFWFVREAALADATIDSLK